MRLIIFSVIIIFLIIPINAQINVAVQKPVEVDSEIASQPSWKAVEGLNYSNSNRWVSDSEGYPHWIIVDLQEIYAVEKVIFYTGEYGTNYPVFDYQIQSWNGSDWVDIVNRTENTNPEVTEEFTPVETSKIRLYASTGEGDKLMLYEIEVYASFNQQPQIDSVVNPEPVYFDQTDQVIQLTGISDGDISEVQNISISATSSNTSVVSDLQINYIQGDSIASLSYTPLGQEGKTTISVLVKDDAGKELGGVDSVVINFDIEIRDPNKNYPPIISSIADVYSFSNKEEYKVLLKGISDGNTNRVESVAINAEETGEAILENLYIDYDQGEESGYCIFNTTGVNGATTIQITLKDDGGTENGGTDSTVIEFNVNVSSESEGVKIDVDINTEHQVMEGFGGFGFEKVTWAHPPFYSDEFIDDILNDLGLTILRISLDPYEFEPENENDDPLVMDMDKFRENIYKGTNGDYINYLKDLYKKGNPKLIVSSWSPPAWMKTNNSVIEGGNLKPEYYEEYAEYVSAYIKLVKQETGVDVYAFSLQNEPTFWEPYTSCQYTPRTYCDLIQVVGKRFEQEGISTKLLYPEEVFKRDYDILPWLNTLNEDTVARNYVDIMALHGYDGTGVSAGSIGNDLWETYYDLANHPAHPKQLWITETSGQPNTLDGALNMIIGLSNAIKYGQLNAWVFWTISGEVVDPDNPEHIYDLMLSGKKLKKYFTSKNYYRYVRPGAVAVETSSSDVDILVNAFIHKEDNTFTLVLINRSNSNKVVNLSSYGITNNAKMYRTSETEDCEEIPIPGPKSIQLPPKSISTIYDYSSFSNNPPSFNIVRDTTFIAGEPSYEILLNDISDGNLDKDQSISFSATSSDPDFVTPSIQYNNGETEAKLILNPVASQLGDVTITIKIEENDTANIDNYLSFSELKLNVSFINPLNLPPTVNLIMDTIFLSLSDTSAQVQLTGISDGNTTGLEQLVSVEYVSSSQPGVIQFEGIDYIQGDSVAMVNISPLQAGTSTINLVVQDNGGVENGGDNSTSISFVVKVEDDIVDIQYTDQPGNLISVYPNPANTFLYISQNIGFKNTYYVFDVSGKEKLNGNIDSSIIKIDISDYAEGVYFVVVVDDKGKIISKSKVVIDRTK